MKRLRILLLSQQNNPDWISVPLVGYQHSAALAALHDVTLITHVDNRDAILKRQDPFKAVESVDLGIWERFYTWAFINIFREDFGSQILTVFRIPFYYAFEWKTWRRYKKALKSGEYDLVSRITPVAPVIPSLFASRCKAIGVPFVIGPINGGLAWPKGYSQAQRQKEWVSNLRSFYRFMPFARSTFRDASAIVAGSSETYHEYRALAPKVFFMPENGIREETVGPFVPRDPKAILKLLFVGRLIPSKACDLAIKAAAGLVREGRAELTVVGDGTERPALEKLAEQLGIQVKFTGMIPHGETMEYFQKSDVLVFPSIREFGGGVVFEAFTKGCVPIVSNGGGPGDIVIDRKTGLKVDLKGEEYTIEGFRTALETLERDRNLLEKMIQAGRAYSLEELSWHYKAIKMSAIFMWCLGEGERPLLLPPVIDFSF